MQKLMVMGLALVALAGCAGSKIGTVKVDQAQLGAAIGASVGCVSSAIAVATDEAQQAACRAALEPTVAACRTAVEAGQRLVKDAQ